SSCCLARSQKTRMPASQTGMIQGNRRNLKIASKPTTTTKNPASKNPENLTNPSQPRQKAIIACNGEKAFASTKKWTNNSNTAHAVIRSPISDPSGSVATAVNAISHSHATSILFVSKRASRQPAQMKTADNTSHDKTEMP